MLMECFDCGRVFDKKILYKEKGKYICSCGKELIEQEENKMKKFRVVVSYCGAIPLEIKAKDEDEAQEIAERTCENMPDEEFLMKLEPQHEETQVEEIK